MASGESIRTYIQDTADAGGITPHIRFATRVVAVVSEPGRWTVRPGRRRHPDLPFLYACAGYYDYEGGHQPDFPGLRTSPAGSCTRSPGPTTSTTPAGASWSSAAARPP